MFIFIFERPMSFQGGEMLVPIWQNSNSCRSVMLSFVFLLLYSTVNSSLYIDSLPSNDTSDLPVFPYVNMYDKEVQYYNLNLSSNDNHSQLLNLTATNNLSNEKLPNNLELKN